MKFKKLTSLLVAFVISLSFVACGKVDSESKTDDKNKTDQAVPYDEDDKDKDDKNDKDDKDQIEIHKKYDEKKDKSAKKEFVVYSYDVNDDELVANIYRTDKLTPQIIFDKLKELGVVTKNAKMNSFDISEADGVDTGFLDVNKDFLNPKLGSSAEGLMLDAVAQSFIGNLPVDQIQLSVDEGIYESGHIVLDAGDFLKPTNKSINNSVDKNDNEDVEADEN